METKPILYFPHEWDDKQKLQYLFEEFYKLMEDNNLSMHTVCGHCDNELIVNLGFRNYYEFTNDSEGQPLLLCAGCNNNRLGIETEEETVVELSPLDEFVNNVMAIPSNMFMRSAITPLTKDKLKELLDGNELNPDDFYFFVKDNEVVFTRRSFCAVKQ